MGALLVKKLLIKPGRRLAILNAPPDYRAELGPLPDGVTVVDRTDAAPAAGCDVVQLFVKNLAEVARLTPEAERALTPGGILWICYPKGSSKVKTDLNRDILWEALSSRGLSPVTLVAVNTIWSAMRFRPSDQVGT
jgi:hypothetical protein